MSIPHVGHNVVSLGIAEPPLWLRASGNSPSATSKLLLYHDFCFREYRAALLLYERVTTEARP